MKAILADDHALFRDGFVLLLQQHEPDMQCRVADTFDDALACLQGDPDVDLLMLDLNMPGMLGARSVQAVQEAHPGLPVVILSGEERASQMEALLAAGASGYIPKSSSAPVMISAIRLVLAGGVYVPPQMMTGARSTPRVQLPDTAMHLTGRQLDVLRLLAQGRSNKLICRELDISEGTLKTHINAIYRVLNVINRTEAALEAKRLGLVD
jgi:DNA-binding NarL/FixJ family response regulator